MTTVTLVLAGATVLLVLFLAYSVYAAWKYGRQMDEIQRTLDEYEGGSDG